MRWKNAKLIDTPIATAIRLDMNEYGKPEDEKKYKGIIVSLLYLAASRPNIVYHIELCAMFQYFHKRSDMKVVKRILRYLKGSQDLGLWYPRSGNFELVGFSDADYARYLIDKKHTSCMAHFLSSCLASWATKK